MEDTLLICQKGNKVFLRTVRSVFASLSKKALLIHIAFLSCTGYVAGQHSVLTYNVVQNNDVIGWLKLDKNDSANSFRIKFSSEIRKRMVFLLTIIEQQEALFQNGILTYSYLYRKINDDIKVEKHTTHAGDHYLIRKAKSSTALPLNNIAYNQLSLYFFEPSAIKEVYSDNYERYLKIQKVGNEYYTLMLPGGNKTTYFYTNGICSKVKVEQALFSVDFVLVR